MYKKGWVPCQLPTLQWRGLVKFRLWGFPSTPITILVWESKGPNRKGRTEKAAPASKRKFTSLPSICSHPRIERSDLDLTIRGNFLSCWALPVPVAQDSHRGNRCRLLHSPSLWVIWTLPFPMAILSAVGTLGVSQLQCIFKILFSSLLSHSLLSHSGRMNQGQDFSLLLGQGLGLKWKGLLSFQASF